MFVPPHGFSCFGDRASCYVRWVLVGWDTVDLSDGFMIACCLHLIWAEVGSSIESVICCL